MTKLLENLLQLVPPIKELQAELAKRHLKDFISFTKKDYTFNWHHEMMCEYADRFARKQIKKLLIFAPPQHGKSEITTRRLPAYLLGRNPRTRIAIISYSKELAMSFNRDIQRIIDDHDYRYVFPETVLNRSNVVSSAKSNYLKNNTMFETVPYKGGVRTVGVEGSLTGFPVDVAIFDDLYKSRDEAMSAKRQSTIKSFWESVLIPRLHNDSQILGTFTRWSENDLGGFLMETENDWVVMSLPAIKDIQDDNDPRQIGEALWPERHSLERLTDIKKKSPIVFLSLYQQKPQAPNEIKILRYALIDAMPTHLPFRYGVDFGFENDPTVILQLAWETKGRKKYIYVNEVLYKTQMTNGLIKKHITDRGIPNTGPYYADRDPKDIKELKLLGLNFIAAHKPSIVGGLNTLKDGLIDYDDKGQLIETRLFVTRTSFNTIRDFDNYQWEVFNGKPINVPVPGNDHSCFIGSTLIETIEGFKPIRYLSNNDLVKTSNGFRKVIALHDNGVRRVNDYLLQFDTFCLSLTCTSDHKVRVDNKWVEISILQSGQMVSLSNILMVGNISYNQVRDTSSLAIDTCMSMCGKVKTANVLKDFIYTTKMKILGIINRTILNLSKHLNIFQYTVKTLSYPMSQGQRLSYGMEVRRALSGISGTQEIMALENLHLGIQSVKSVTSDTSEKRNHRSSVTQIVKLKRLDVGESYSRQVFDITVDQDHEYFANGVLVHNCDALRYGYVTAVTGAQSKGGASAY